MAVSSSLRLVRTNLVQIRGGRIHEMTSDHDAANEVNDVRTAGNGAEMATLLGRSEIDPNHVARVSWEAPARGTVANPRTFGFGCEVVSRMTMLWYK